MIGRLAFAGMALLLPWAVVAQDSPPEIPAPQASAETTGYLGWMTGDWQTGNVTDGFTREHWEPMRGGTKLGLSQTVKGRVARGFEYMRIVRHVEGLVFYGAPSGGPPVPFAQASLIERPDEGHYEVVFVNATHDFPKRISYRLAGETGNMLIATVSGATPETDAMTWQYHRAGPGE